MTENPNPIDKHVGRRVQIRRKALGMSQTNLADRIGISFQQVQKYETGINRIGASRLQHIAKILNAPIPFFFEGAPGQQKVSRTAPSPNAVTEFVATSEGLALVKAFTRIKSHKARRAIVMLVEAIAGDE